jgi:drug/metabolite transporter (DMT)-like permease
MNTKIIIGLLLIVAGIAVLVGQGISFTTTEKAIDLGPLQVTAEKEHLVPPIVGVIALAGGTLLLIGGGLSTKRSNS